MSTNGKEYKLAIRIAGILDKTFGMSLASAKVQLNSFRSTMKTMDQDFTKLDKGYSKIMKAGKACFDTTVMAAEAATIAITAATAASIKYGSEFESSFAGVKKTVDATDAQYAKLRQDILDMTRVIPSSASDIAKVMEIAGQLGIATDSLTDFTETMINMDVSTNLSAEDAATRLAKFANIMQMADFDKSGVSNWERLGSTIVDLGNKFATTEDDITEMSLRLASAAKQVGLTEAQVVSLSTAMSSVGIYAESGGSTMSKLLKKMQLATELGSGLSDYASVANMTEKQFKELFKEDAVKALSAFVGGLNDTKRNGKSAIAILNDMDLKEIRLSNTILALANAHEVLDRAVEVGNNAWAENTALATEAGKRYETAESKVQLMKNAFQELGIVAYDELREPYVDAIDLIIQKVTGLTNFMGSSNGVTKWIRDINTEMPTLQRNVKKYSKPLTSLLGVLRAAGEWCADNKDTVIGLITGVGTALITYKISSTIVHLTNALLGLTAMSGPTLAVLGMVAAISALTGAVTAYKIHEKDLINSSLEKHFGNVALSMKDIQAAAEYIVNSESLTNVKKALDEFDGLSEISGTIENAVADLNKMNWMVSIGMELTPDEQDSYKTAVDEYVQAAKEYVQQSQYAVSLNLAVSLGDSEEGTDIAAKVNQFYQNSYDEMTSLGQSLSDAVNEAFSDNILDASEITQISDLQAKMAEVQKNLATGQFDAALSVLQMDYTSGSGLTADSFLDLQEKISDEIETAKQAYTDSYKKSYAALSASHASGALSDEDFQNGMNLAQKDYLQNLANLNVRSASFQVDTVMGAYKNVLTNNIAAMNQNISDEIDSLMQKGYNNPQDWQQGLQTVLQNVQSGFNISKSDSLALGDFYDSMQTQLQQLKDVAAEYQQAGETIPDEITDAINNIYSIGAVSGNQGALWELIGHDLSDSEKYATVIALAQEAGSTIPEEIIDAMTNDGVMADIQENVDYILESIKTGLGEGVDITIPVYYDLVANGIKSKDAGISSSDINVNAFRSGEQLDRYINHRADGGLATSPELTWFAENSPEMAIPIDGSKNAISLWERTGKLLGMESKLDSASLDGGSSPTIEYSPVLQFYGSAPSKEDLTDALKISQDEFESMMDKYLKNHGRVAFG